MMVELFGAATALFAMMRAQQPLAAYFTPGEPGLIDIFGEVGVLYDSVDGVVSGNPHIVVDNVDEEGEVEADKDVEDGVLSDYSFGDWSEDVCDVQRYKYEVQEDGEDTEWRWSVGACILGLIGHPSL